MADNPEVGVPEVGVVVIGRNEGERLIRCLTSLTHAGVTAIVYVDSGSTDGSPAAARRLGAEVVALDMTQPFTAARARNAGEAALPAPVSLVQFVDGDCEVQPGWIDTARAALTGDPGLAVVFGRRRERFPEASRYNWLCDREWAVPPGPVRYCGGDTMIRRAALREAGGYPETMIAGEEPDLSIRLRAKGWRLECLPAEMTLHDAAITRFGQWWTRAVRSGHAYAELGARHGGDYAGRLRGVMLWGVALPAGGLVLLLAGILWWPLAVLGLVALGLIAAQTLRLYRRERRRHPAGDAWTLAWSLMLAKPAQAQGAWRYWRRRMKGERATLIEYKG